MRLAGLTKEQLDPAQLDLYEQIVSGPRASGARHFALVDSSGGLTGPFGVMLHEPALGQPLQDLGAAIRYRTDLSDRVREIAILSVAAATSSEFELYAHQRVARAIGMSDEELAALAGGLFTSENHFEETAYRLCQSLNYGDASLKDDEFDAFRDVLGEKTMIDLVVLVGYYTTLASLLRVFDVGVVEES